jgi:hypothetical protein
MENHKKKNKIEAAAVTRGKRERARMNPAKMDRPSLALRDKVDAKFFASSDKGQRLLKKSELFWSALPKRFFIELGKCLSGEIKSKADEIDTDIAHIIAANSSITAADAVRELETRGWHITQEAFRMRKQRLKRAAAAAHEAYDRLLSTAKT